MWCLSPRPISFTDPRQLRRTLPSHLHPLFPAPVLLRALLSMDRYPARPTPCRLQPTNQLIIRIISCQFTTSYRPVNKNIHSIQHDHIVPSSHLSRLRSRFGSFVTDQTLNQPRHRARARAALLGSAQMAASDLDREQLFHTPTF